MTTKSAKQPFPLKPSPLTAPDLCAYADNHVRYELQMLTDALRWNTEGSSIFFKNLHAEAIALHLRNLIEFSYPDEFQAKADDVSAHHFLAPTVNWLAVRPPLSPILRAAKTRADKEVAHLTTARQAGTPPGKWWNGLTLWREIEPALRAFAVHADPALLGPAMCGLLLDLFPLTHDP